MRDSLKRQLFDIAKRKAQRSNYKLDPTLERTLKDFIDKGVDNMTSIEYNSARHKQKAKNNVEILIERMVRNAQSRRITENLDTKSFSNTRSSICPLWPFC